MGDDAWNNYLYSIQVHIEDRECTLKLLERDILRLTTKIHEGNHSPAKTAEHQANLEQKMHDLPYLQAEVSAAKEFQANIQCHWNGKQSRIMGHVLWSPPYGVGDDPYPYSRDLCIIELDKDKFRSFDGNRLSLGMRYFCDRYFFSNHLFQDMRFPPNKSLAEWMKGSSILRTATSS
jgi:hypothetical protein